MSVSELPELLKILKELEQKRDLSRDQFTAVNLVEQFWLVQINIFTSVYFTTIAEIAFEAKDLPGLYQSYARSRQTPVRYLVELFLTFAHVLALPEKDRFNEIYSLGLSERINIHKIDLELDRLLKNEDSKAKLDRNRLGYINFLKAYGKNNPAIPDALDEFFKTEGDSIKTTKIGDRFNFRYFKHNKLDNYTQEIENNLLISLPLRKALLLSYPFLSIDVHPTMMSLEDFEIFIMKNEVSKREHIKMRNEYLATILKHLGKNMIFLTDRVLNKNAQVIT